MVASAFLPVTYYKNRLYFLFGKEAHDDSAPGFSDFGGGVKSGEDIYLAGLREFAEETTGFLGDPKELEELIKKNGGCYPFAQPEHGYPDFQQFRAFPVRTSGALPPASACGTSNSRGSCDTGGCLYRRMPAPA